MKREKGTVRKLLEFVKNVGLFLHGTGKRGSKELW